MYRKYFHYLIVLVVIGLLSHSCRTPERFKWIESTADSPWIQKYGLAIKEVQDTVFDVIVETGSPGQKIDGFGACFNELGWDALQKLSEEKREEVMRDLFDTVQGLKLNICRMPIGANDYSRNYYSLDDSINDFAMKYFNIDRDKETLIPYIKLALKYNPTIRIWGSPWCPPAWMKTNSHYACHPDASNDLKPEGAGMEGRTQFRMQEKYLGAYAKYFSLYVSAYRKQGIPVYAVHVQNEMNSCQSFPSCIWTAKDLGLFIGKFLGPEMRKNNPDAQIWYGTVERPFVEKLDTVMNDADASGYISGAGFQWAGKLAIAGVHAKYPKLKLMETETECGDGANDWKAASYTFSLMQHYFNSGASIYSFWNPVLDETGKSQWGWKQNSMISINSKTLSVSYNPEFYLLKHFSSFIRPGARKFSLTGSFKNLLAFQNPNGTIIIVVENKEKEARELKMRVGGKQLLFNLSSQSFNSLILDLN